MGNDQGAPSPFVPASKPSSFSTVSSAASATSAASSRSGGSKLLFGEIDINSVGSEESYASVCSIVLCYSSTFLKFWLDDKCRDKFLSHVPRRDLASLRLACHDFSVRAAPALFNDLSITFKASTFTRPAKLAALDRLGFYVKTLSFNLPHSSETFLPPLVEPETGAELSFTYTPQINISTAKTPKYGDAGTTEILTRQYPALFHAATNVPAFVRAFSAFFNLTHLKISCPDYDVSSGNRRSIVDFALISVRIAVEQNCLNSLDTLTLSPIHSGAMLYLSPVLGYGATPRAASRWSRIRHLTIHSHALPVLQSTGVPDHVKLLQSYLHNFQRNLATLNFRWIGQKGPMPLQRPVQCDLPHSIHPAHRDAGDAKVRALHTRKAARPIHFSKLTHFGVENVATQASEISAFVEGHKRTIEDLNLEDIQFTCGTWDDALAPLIRLACPRRSQEVADIPIMLSPTTARPFPPQ